MSDIDLSTLKNPHLLDFICRLALSQEKSRRNCFQTTGYDPLEFNVAIQTARHFGLVRPGKSPCGFEISPTGMQWAADQLSAAHTILTLYDRQTAAEKGLAA